MQLADVVCSALPRAYDSTKTTEESAALLGLIRNKHALVIDEWPIRYRAASGTGGLLAGTPADDEVARYCVPVPKSFLSATRGPSSSDTPIPARKSWR